MAWIGHAYLSYVRMFSKKKWIHDRFCTSAINADKNRKVVHLTGF